MKTTLVPLLITLAIVSLPQAAFAQHPPGMGYMFPPGGQAGQTIEVILGGYDWTPDTQLFARRLLDAITRPVIWDGSALGVKASIGIVIADGASLYISDPVAITGGSPRTFVAQNQNQRPGLIVGVHEGANGQLVVVTSAGVPVLVVVQAEVVTARPATTAPPGPAMPVVDRETCASEFASAPSAIAAAISSLTAPCCAMSEAEMSNISVFDELE